MIELLFGFIGLSLILYLLTQTTYLLTQTTTEREKQSPPCDSPKSATHSDTSYAFVQSANHNGEVRGLSSSRVSTPYSFGEKGLHHTRLSSTEQDGSPSSTASTRPPSPSSTSWSGILAMNKKEVVSGASSRLGSGVWQSNTRPPSPSSTSWSGIPAMNKKEVVSGASSRLGSGVWQSNTRPPSDSDTVTQTTKKQASVSDTVKRGERNLENKMYKKAEKEFNHVLAETTDPQLRGRANAGLFEVHVEALNMESTVSEELCRYHFESAIRHLVLKPQTKNFDEDCYRVVGALLNVTFGAVALNTRGMCVGLALTKPSIKPAIVVSALRAAALRAFAEATRQTRNGDDSMWLSCALALLRKCKKSCEDLEVDCTDLKDSQVKGDLMKEMDFNIESCKARLNIVKGDEQKKKALTESKNLNMNLIWSADDLYDEAAYIASNSGDVESEASAKGKRGLLFSQVMKDDKQAFPLLKEAIRLFLTITDWKGGDTPSSWNNIKYPSWYIEVTALFQKLQQMEEQKEQNKEAEKEKKRREEAMKDKKVKAQVDELGEKSTKLDPVSFVKWVLKNHPRSNGSERLKDISTKLEDLQKLTAMNDRDRLIKQIVLATIRIYHPDKAKEGENHFLHTQITTYLNAKYDLYKVSESE
eukprot:GHVN01106103.1.p1 GENE.GHVN01106103.1~~GHVN01106103.1.p1  ORF type:complete len:645 (+),score=128.42 GHVN01106103.1:217-2151(+)